MWQPENKNDFCNPTCTPFSPSDIFKNSQEILEPVILKSVFMH